MMRNLKVLGLALVAVFAMSAVAASMASADDLTSEVSPVTLTGAQEENDVLTTTAGNISCKEIKYKGTAVTPTTTVSVTPEYPEKSGGVTNCTALGFPMLVDVNGCSYLFHIGAGVTTGTLDIVCPAGKEITVTVNYLSTVKCIIHVPAQTGLGPVTYTNVGSGATREITVSAKITNLKYSHTRPAGEPGLGACTTGSGTTGSYNGKVIVTGEKDNGGTEHVGIFLS
jgi:hypothetical protein